MPWQASSEKELAQKMLTIPVNFPGSVKISAECKDFIRRCLIVSEVERASIDELERHPWVKGPDPAFQISSNKPHLTKAKTLEYREGKENSGSKRPSNESFHRNSKKHVTQAPLTKHSKQSTRVFEDSDCDYTVQAQLNFCKYLQKVAGLLESTKRFSTEWLREKLHFFVVKNIVMKMCKLRDLVSAQP